MVAEDCLVHFSILKGLAGVKVDLLQSDIFNKLIRVSTCGQPNMMTMRFQPSEITNTSGGRCHGPLWIIW